MENKPLHTDSHAFEDKGDEFCQRCGTRKEDRAWHMQNWETEFRNRDFFTFMDGNAPITDIIAYIRDLLTAQRAELAEKVKALKNNTQKETGAYKYDFAYEEVLVLLQP